MEKQRTGLVEVFSNGKKGKAVELLKNTEKPGEIRDSDNWTLLHYAARHGWTDVCQLLVEQYQVDPHVKDISSGYTALYYACLYGHEDTVKYLVSHVQCDPLMKSSGGYTPLSLSNGRGNSYLEDVIAQSKKEGFTNVADYNKALKEREERQSFLDEAMAEGKGDLFQCNIVFHGPPGAGKSSVKALILGKPPRPKHEQTATDIVEKCVRTVSVERVAASSNQKCFEEVDNDDIITRITAEVEKYRQKKKLTERARVLDQYKSSSLFSNSNSITVANHETGTTSTPDETSTSHDKTSITPVDAETTSDDNPPDDESDSSTLSPSVKSLTVSHDWRQRRHPRSGQQSRITHTKTIKLVLKALGPHFSTSYKPVFDSRWLHHIDSGGQPQFLDVFPLMYRSPNSHFVVVMRLTDGLDERPKVRFYIEGKDEYCLPDHLVLSNREMIIRMCQVARRISRASGGKFTPRVFVVGTHNDKLKPIVGSIRRRSITSELLRIHEEYKDVLVCKTPGEQVMFMINAMAMIGKERLQYMEELQKHILSATEPKVGDSIKVPLKWLLLHLELDKSKDVVRMESCVELASKIGITKERVRTALEFLNKAALILYYPDDVPDLVITKMDPFTSRLSKLIKASFIVPDNGPTKESDELREKGVFKKSFLQQVFHDVADNLISDEEFLKLLESLKIAVHIGGDEYFLPSALSLKPPLSGSCRFKSNSNPLALLWDELILPHGFFLTVSVELQDKAGLGREGYMFELRKDKPQWRGEIQLSEAKKKIPGVVKLIDRQCWIQVSFSGDNSYCPIVYHSINTAVKRAIKRLKHTGIDSPTVGCVCPLCNKNDHPSSISEDKRFITCSLDNDKTGPVTTDIACWFEGGVLRGQATSWDKEQQPKELELPSGVYVPPSNDVPDGIDDLKDISPLDMFNSHTHEIMGVVSDTDSLITGLVSEGILPDTTTTTDGTIGRHERVEKMMINILSCMEESSNPTETLVKFSNVLMNQDNVTLKKISADMRSQLILTQSPIPKDVFNVFRSKASQWEEIGIELEVRPDYRDQLRMEGVQSSNYSKLERILREWVESMSSEVSWYTILKVLRDLQYYEILKSTRSWLKQEDILKKYL